MIAAKHFDMVVGVDVHIILIPTPGGPVPTPIPHPFVGMMFDPDDYDLVAELANVGLDIQPMLDLKSAVESKIAEVQDGMDQFSPKAQVNKLIDKAKAAVTDKIAAAEQALTDALGIEPGPSGHATVKINGLPRSHITSKGIGMPPHIPIGGPFQKPPPNECEAFLGSMTVNADKEHLCFLGCMAKSCQDTAEFPNSTIIAVPKGMPVIVGGAPVPSLNQLKMKAFAKAKGAAKKAFGKALEALKKTKLAKAISQKIQNAAAKAMDILGVPADSLLRNQVSDKICETTGHPVVIATGRVFTEQVDFELPGPIPLQWSRKWNSTSRYQGPFGYGWHGNYDLSLAYEGDAVVVRMADGRPVIFPPVRIGERFTNLYENLTLIRSQTAYLMKDQGLDYRFEIQSENKVSDVLPLTCIETKSGHKLQFSYDTNGHLSGIIDSGGRQLAVHTDVHGRITAIDAPHPDKEGETFTIVSYAYDEIGNLVKDINALGNPFTYDYQQHLLIKETNRNGLSFHFEYDGADDHARCIRTWGDGGIYNHKLIYDLEEQWTTVEDSLGNITTHWWDDSGICWKTRDPKGGFSYLQVSNLFKIKSETNELGQVIRYEYDDFGNRTKIINADGNALEFVFDAHKLSSKTNAAGTWKYEYDEFDRIIQEINPLGQTREYLYESAEEVQILFENGVDASMIYNKQTLLISAQEKFGSEVRYEYDFLGREISRQYRDIISRVKYDLVGNQIQAIDRFGAVSFAYDGEGNIKNSLHRDRQITYKYSGNSWLSEIVDQESILKFSYDLEGNLIEILDQDGRQYSYRFDEQNVLIKEEGPDGKITKYKNDACGQAIEIKGTNSLLTSIEYDSVGNIISAKNPDGFLTTFEYRADGLLISAKTPFSQVTFVYDVLGKKIEESQNGIVLKYEYDDFGRKERVCTDLGLDTTYRYDEKSRLSSIYSSAPEGTWNCHLTYNNKDKIEQQIVQGTIINKRRYDQYGRLINDLVTAIGQENAGIDRGYEWDDLDQLIGIYDKHGPSLSYKYDKNGSLVYAKSPSHRERRFYDEFDNVYLSKNKTDCKYGAAGQLLSKDQISFTYDSEGNLIGKQSKSGEKWNYSWYSSGLLQSVKPPEKERVYFVYDALGRRIAKLYDHWVTHWIWDTDVIVHEWREEKSKLEYNSLIKSIQNVSNVESPLFSHQKEAVHELISFVHHPETMHPLAKLTKKNALSIFSDEVGTPHVAVDNDLSTWRLELSLNGEVQKTTGKLKDCEFRYLGQYHDSETGLHYNRCRYYDPSMGSYISQDPIGNEGGLNRYSFLSDPKTSIDFYGLAEEEKHKGRHLALLIVVAAALYGPVTPDKSDDLPVGLAKVSEVLKEDEDGPLKPSPSPSPPPPPGCGPSTPKNGGGKQSKLNRKPNARSSGKGKRRPRGRGR